MKRLILISASVLIASAAIAQAPCVSGQVNVNANKVTLTSSGDKRVTNEKQYVYYERRHPRKHEREYAVAGINDKWPSCPLLLNANKKVSALPERYNVTLSAPDNVSVCPDSVADVNATINVEKVSSYTGNYPSTTDNASYTRVSKHHYKMAARKMRKIDRNEEKVARRTGNTVEAHSTKV